jgi:hypothetical protein
MTFDLDRRPAASPRLEAVQRLIGDDRSWLFAALAANLLIGWNGDGASSLAWLNPLLFVVALAVRWADLRLRPRRLRLGRAASAAAMVAIGWTIGMFVEVTLAADGDGFGGMHPDTVPSFVLAQGYYLPAVLCAWWAVRRYGLDVRRAFWFAGALAWWEALTVGAVSLLSPWFPFAPVLAAYYVATYALCGMGGLLVVDVEALHAPTPRPISTRRLVAYGLAAGALSWAAFMVWAVLSSRLVGFEL